MKLLRILGYVLTAWLGFTLGLGFAVGYDSAGALWFTLPLVAVFAWLLAQRGKNSPSK